MFKEGCKKKHFAPICEGLSECKDIKRCEKRHPKNSKNHSSVNGCKHGEKCAYNHYVYKHDEESTELKEKVDMLEKKVAGMENHETSRLEMLKKSGESSNKEGSQFRKWKEDYGEKTVEKTLATNKLGSIEESKFENEKEHENKTETSKVFNNNNEADDVFQDPKKVSKPKDIKFSVFKFRVGVQNNVL